MMAPAADAVMVMAGVDPDGQGFGGARAQQGQGESGNDDLFHFCPFRVIAIPLQRRQTRTGSGVCELLAIGGAIRDAATKE